MENWWKRDKKCPFLCDWSPYDLPASDSHFYFASLALYYHFFVMRCDDDGSACMMYLCHILNIIIILHIHTIIYVYSYAFIVYQFYIYFLYPFYITYVYIYTFYYTWLSVTSLQVCVFFFERLNCPRKRTVTVE